ncbi:contractile injection system tape measure protein [Chitinophaga sp.]|uniref:contractile injection system tape measure protein n=1 Tax=Chitinophaga sp. TaxID=1869181 RepID=UPI002C8A3258|nr:contractile injection system tape measure protein [Chitinophaga sp.]HWV64282.1 contractile injection system tape measure protein [Chitinophaga sp.]
MEAHIIRRYSFDITYDSRPKAFALQDKVSMLFRQSISNSVDELLQQLIPADMMASIDGLVLNIGAIPVKDMETELPAKILAALRQMLTDLLHHQHAGTQHAINGDITIRKGDDRQLELMTFFLLQGVMPWWATAAERAQPGDIILQLSKSAPGKLADFIRSTGRSRSVRERIVWQFPVTVLQAIVEVLEPAEALFIIAGSREILLLQQQQQLLQTETSELEKAVWLFMLTYLIMERGSNFNRREFVRNNLLQLAGHFNLSYETILALFYDAWWRYKSSMPETGLGSYIKSLYEELTVTPQRKHISSGDPSYKKLMADTGEQINVLRYYLLYGAIPWWAPGVTPASLQQMFANTGYRSAASLKQMLQVVLQHPTAAGRWNNLMQTNAAVVEKTRYLQEIKNWADNTIAAAPFAPDTATKRLLLRDVILHLLTYGSISWWGKAYAHFSLNSLLEQLADQHPDQTLTILEYAATLPAAMQRLVTGVKPAVFFRLLKTSGMSTAAEEVYDNVYTLLIAVQQFVSITAQPLEHFILQAIWQSLAATRYRRINKEILLQHLFLPAWSAAPVAAPRMIRFLLQQLLPVINHLSGNTILASDLQAWTFPMATVQGTERLPAQLPVSPQTITQWLRQFLSTGLLPAAAGNTSASYAARLLQWLYEYHEAHIKILQDSITLSPLLFVQLEELFLQLEPHIEPVQALLQPWLDKIIAADHLSAGGGTFTGGIFTAGGVFASGNSSGTGGAFAGDAAGRRHQPAVAYRSLLQRMQRYTAITAERQQQEILEEARQLLTVFLTRHRLPEKLGALSLSAANEIIKAAVILLFNAVPGILQQLFSSYRQQLAARLQVYGLFSFYAGAPDSHIRQSLDVYAVQDSLLLLQESAGSSSSQDGITDLRKAVRFYRQRSRQERKLFYSKILQHTALIEQMAQHLDEASFLDIMQDAPLGWTANATDALHELQQLLEGMLPGSQEKIQLQQVFRRFHLLLLGAHLHVYDARSYALRFLDFIKTAAPGIAGILTARLVKSAQQPEALSHTHIRHVMPALQQEAQLSVNAERHRTLLRESLYEKDRQQVAAGTANDPEMPPQDPESWSKVKKPPLDTIYTGNAGLILLHPFIPYGFKRVGLVNDEGFVNREAQHRAIHLLQYMATGKEEHAEHELALNKILCALPLEEPVPAEVLLTPEEKQLCEELLKVVIQRWEKMNNSSVEGFRAAFLQRDGALWEKDGDWWLRIEERGYDLILQTLPWGIGMIKAPWMEKTIYTEWAYS